MGFVFRSLRGDGDEPAYREDEKDWNSTEPYGDHCLNPETCNPDKGKIGCVCRCEDCQKARKK